MTGPTGITGPTGQTGGTSEQLSFFVNKVTDPATTQTIAAENVAIVEFPTISQNIGDDYTRNTFTFQTAGIWSISTSITFEEPTVISVISIIIQSTGTLPTSVITAEQYPVSVGGGRNTIYVGGYFQKAVGETVLITANNGSLNPLVITAGYFTAALISSN
jgi:hypothetical protein